jgi:NitT/TauT family transport system substrate-binding protein
MAVRRCLTALALTALALAGCGGDSGGGSTEKGGITKIAVGAYPVVNFAPLYLGREKGFFRDEKLEVEPKLSEGGAEVLPQVLKGDTQFGFSNSVTVLLAASKKLPIKIVSQASQANSPRKDFSAVVVKRDSGIKTAKDLNGKTIAVNTLKNIGDVTIRAALAKHGADPSSLKFVEVPFPDMNQALDAGRVDAIWALEPFLTEATRHGGKVISYNYAEVAPRLTNTLGFASEKYIQEHGDVVDRFVRAYNRSLEYAQSHPAEARQAVSTYTEIEPATLKKIVLPYWSKDLNEPTLQKLADLMREYGLVKERIDVNEVVEK